MARKASAKKQLAEAIVAATEVIRAAAHIPGRVWAEPTYQFDPAWSQWMYGCDEDEAEESYDEEIKAVLLPDWAPTGAATRLDRKTLLATGDLIAVENVDIDGDGGALGIYTVLGFCKGHSGRQLFFETRPGYYCWIDLYICDVKVEPAC